MFRKLILFGTLLFVLTLESSSFKIETIKKLYQVVPQNQKQLEVFFELQRIHPEINIWGGIGAIGEPVQLIATSEDMGRYQQDTLNEMDMVATIEYPIVKIIMEDGKDSLKETSPQNNVRQSNHLIARRPAKYSHKEESKLRFQSQETVPIKKIPGTDLFTGIYYKIRNKALSQSWLAWSTSSKEYENYCVADNSGSSNYNPGNKWDHDSQWMFVPTELSGWYLWFNRGLADTKFRPTAMSEDNSASGKMVGIYRQERENNRLKIGGDWRRKAYWKPETSSESGYHKIFNKDLGPLTWTNTKHPTFGNYLQLIRDDSHFNPEEMKHKFMPQEVILEAKILDFQYTDTPESLLEQYTKTISIMTRYIPNHSPAEVTSRVEESISTKSTFTWGLTENLKLFSKVTAKGGIPLIAEGEIETGIELEVGSHQEWSTETERKITISQEVKVPPFTSVKISIVNQFIEDLPLPFTAEMVITGTVEGRVLSENGGIVNKVEAAAELILQTIINQGFKAEVISVDGNRVRCKVEGTFTGTFGSKGIFSVTELPKTLKPIDFDRRMAKLATGNRIR